MFGRSHCPKRNDKVVALAENKMELNCHIFCFCQKCCTRAVDLNCVEVKETRNQRQGEKEG